MNNYSVFKKYFLNKKLSHAYIFSGSVRSDKNKLAEETAAAIVCSGKDKPCGICSGCRKAAEHIHPDISIISRVKDRNEIYVSQIRTLKADAAVLPNDAEKKVYIIDEAEAMNPPAQNALLKLLEEPPSYCCFILITENAGSLLPTVRSRCVEIRLAETEKVQAENDKASEFLDVFTGTDREAILNSCFAMEKLNRNDFIQLTEDMKLLAMERLKDASAGKRGDDVNRLLELIDILEKTDIYSTYNVGVGHTVGLFLSQLV